MDNTTQGIDLDREVIERAIRFIESGFHSIIARDTMTNELRKLLSRQQTPVTGKMDEQIQAWVRENIEPGMWEVATEAANYALSLQAAPEAPTLPDDATEEMRLAFVKAYNFEASPERWRAAYHGVKAPATHQATLAAPAEQQQQSKFAPPFAAPAGIDKDAWAEMVGEVAELYGRLLAEKREAHIAKGRDRGMAYYIADGIQWAVGELQRRCRVQGGETKATDPASPPKPAASQQAVAVSEQRFAACVELAHGHSDEHGDFVMVQLPRPDGAFNSTSEMFITAIDAAIASTEQQEKVAPPPRGTGSQHEADERAFKELYSNVMNIPCERTMSHFANRYDMMLYKEGHRDARHAAADLIAEFASRAQRTNNDNKE